MKPAASRSWWIEETLPAKARKTLEREKVDADEFERRIGPRLGSFRGDEISKDAIATPSEEADYIRRLATRVAEVETLLASGGVPLPTHARLLTTMHVRLGQDWNATRERLVGDLRILGAILAIVAKQTAAAPAKRGRKPKTSLAVLLAAVEEEIVRQIEPPRRDAAAIALKVLADCGIQAPRHDQDRPDKAAKRASQKTGRK